MSTSILIKAEPIVVIISKVPTLKKSPYNKTILYKEILDNIDVQKKLSSQMAAAVCASVVRGNIDYGASLQDNISPQHPYMPWLYSK